MSGVASGTDIRGMFDRIAGRYDRANRIMSAGVDVLWRRKTIARLLVGLGDSPRVLDLGAGTLDGAIEILRRDGNEEVLYWNNACLRVGYAKGLFRLRRSIAQTAATVSRSLTTWKFRTPS